MTDGSQASLWRIVQAVAVLLVLGFFLYQAQALLNPVILFLLLWAVMIPFRGRPGHSMLLGIAGILTLLWLLAATGTLLAPFVLAAVLAYILDPLADVIEARGVSRPVAVLLIMVPSIVVLGVAVLILIPAAISELGDVLRQTPQLLERLAGLLESWQTGLAGAELPFLDAQALAERLQGVDSAALVAFLEERQSALASWLWTGMLGVGRGIGSVLTVLGYVALTPVLMYYLIRDWDGVTAAVTDLVPEARRETFLAFAGEVDDLVAGYLRGQITVALTIGTITGVGLAIVSFPYAVTLGLLVAIFSIVPYLGLILSLIPALVIALLSGSVLTSLLKVGVVYGIAQLLDGTVISPRIIGDSVGIHPVWVVLALSLGGFFLGFAGLLIGVPAAAVTKLLIVRGLARYKASEFYRGTAAATGG